jgi:hypothetical protein
MPQGTINEYVFSVTANVWSSSIEVPGNILGVLSSSGNIEIDLGASKFTRAKQSLTAQVSEYHRVRVRSTTTQVIYLLLGYGEASLPDDLAGTQVDVATADTINQPGDVTLVASTATEIAAANGTQREVFIRADAANTGAVRVGTAGVTASTGIAIEPGEGMVLTTSDDVVGYTTAAGEKMQVLSLRLA